MRVQTITGSAAIGLSLLIGLAMTGISRSAIGGGGSESCTSASSCTPTPSKCTFPGPDSVGPTVVADLPDGVSSDGRGPYLKGRDGVIDSRTGTEATLTIYDRTDTVRNVRSFTVNLSKPVPHSGGVPRGTITSRNPSGFVTQRGMVGDTVQNLIDIDVGHKEQAAQMNVSFHINGRFHVLQMGPQANGHCMGGVSLVHGTGTSSGTISRVSRTKWVMDLPAGSVGRLFDIQGSQPVGLARPSWDHAVDKGLYYVRLHYEIGN